MIHYIKSIGNFIKTVGKGVFNITPWGIVSNSLHLGFFISFLILFAFGKNSLFQEKAKFWGLYFFLPVICGLIGALLAWKAEKLFWIVRAWLPLILFYFVVFRKRFFLSKKINIFCKKLEKVVFG